MGKIIGIDLGTTNSSCVNDLFFPLTGLTF